uniref:Uncharacterized protein n=1 Tax=Mandrillus leucophaeus TaxID=9568 RepID=A0A2K5XCG9_MANLE
MLKFNIIIQQYVNFEALSCLILRFLVIIHTSPHDSYCHITLSQYNGKTRTYFHKHNTCLMLEKHASIYYFSSSVSYLFFL